MSPFWPDQIPIYRCPAPSGAAATAKQGELLHGKGFKNSSLAQNTDSMRFRTAPAPRHGSTNGSQYFIPENQTLIKSKPEFNTTVKSTLYIEIQTPI